MGLLDVSIQAGQSAGDTADAAARNVAQNYLQNEQRKYEQQAGVGELAGIGLGYVAAKKRTEQLIQKPPAKKQSEQSSQTPAAADHSQLVGSTALHAMKEWHPMLDFSAQSAATPASLGALTGSYNLSGGPYG